MSVLAGDVRSETDECQALGEERVFHCDLFTSYPRNRIVEQ